MTKRGNRPQRTCLGCGARDDQAKLLRIVAEQGGLKAADGGNGRGGYLHRARECWQGFLRRKNLHRAFHAEISKDAKEKFVHELQNALGVSDGKNESPSAG